MILLEGFLLWAAISALVIVVAFEVVWEREGLAVFTMVAGGFAIWYLTGATNLLPWLRSNWDTILFLVVAHVVIGGIWAIVNWRLFFLPDMFDKYQTSLKDWKWQYENWAGVKANNTLDEYIAKQEKEHGFPPVISQHKADFFYWMWWWEIHALWTLSHKPIQRISRWFYDAVSGLLNRMSSDYFSKRKANG